MHITDNYEIRQRKVRGEFSEIYRYDVIPEKLRNQICFILMEILDNFKNFSNYDEENFLLFTLKKIKKEIGRLELADIEYKENEKNILFKEIFFFLQEELNIEIFLTALEIICNNIKLVCTDMKANGNKNIYKDIINLLNEMNDRFQQNRIGYQYIYEGEIFAPIGNGFLQENVIQPIFELFDILEFEIAKSEFKSAYEKFRDQDYSHALVDANSSFESTLKAIIKNCKLKCENMKSVPKMIGAILNSNLIDESMSKQIWVLQDLFMSISQPRHQKGAAHGRDEKVDIPERLIECVLYSTATCMLFLAKSYQEYMKNQNVTDR